MQTTAIKNWGARRSALIRLGGLFALLACAVAGFGQGSSNIVGIVTDPAGAAVPNATLTLTETAIAVTRVVQSNDEGLFRFNDLRPGGYTLAITAANFKALNLPNINLISSETRDLGKLILQLGELTEKITVSTQVTPVQTASSERSASVLPEQLTNLSLKGRDPFAMIQLLPGVEDGSVGVRENANVYSMNNIAINGMRSEDKNVTLDGVSEMDEGGNWGTFVSPNMDAIAEMRVLTNGYQAEYGRQAGGSINVVTKSGTRDFHGAGHWDHRHEDMNANTFFNNRQGLVRPIYRYMIAGYGIGGPVFIPRKWNTDRRRLFFFLSQEFTQIAQPTATSTANEPTAAELSGDFSNSRNSLGQVITITNPTTGTPFPGNKVPSSMIDPTGMGILKLLLPPNGYVNPAPGQQYTANFVSYMTPPFTHSDTILRFDANITDKWSMWYRLGWDTQLTDYPFTVAPGIGVSHNGLPGYTHGIHLTYVASPTVVNQVLFGIGHNNWWFTHTTPDSQWFRSSNLNPPLLFPMPTGPTWQYQNYLPCATFSGGQAVGMAYFTPGGESSTGCNLNPYKNYNDNYTFQDDVSKVVGTHSFKAGAFVEYNWKIDAAGYSGVYAGSFNFGSTPNNPLDTGYGYANALLGIFQTYQQNTGWVHPNHHFWQIEWYLQDSWRVRKNFTVDYGLRMENQHPVTDDSGTISDFYQQLWTPATAPVLYQQGSVNGKSAALNPLTGQTTYASLIGTIIPGAGNPVDGMHIGGLTGNDVFYTTTPVVFAPRLGFAWDPWGDGKTAVRASAGIFYNRTLNGNVGVGGSGAPPVIYTDTLYYSYINSIPLDASAAALAPTTATAIGGDHKQQEHVYEYNFTLQRQIGFQTVVDVAYVGNFDRDAISRIPLNQIPLGAYSNPQNVFNNTEINANLVRTRYPGMGAITYTCYCNSAVNYNALQAQVQHRLTRGLEFGAAFTFERDLGTENSTATIGQSGVTFDTYHTSKWWYGPNGEDRPLLMTWNFSYDLPIFGLRNKVAKAVLGRWSLSGIGIITRGGPVTPSCTSTAAFPYSDPTLSGGAARCEAIGNPNDFTHSFFSNFNTAAFVLAPIGTFGNTGPGILWNPTWWNLDLALDKRIAIREWVSIRLRFQAFNVFNHAEFNSIGTTYSFNAAGVNLNTTTGQYTGTQPARQLALTARIEF